MKFNRFNEKVKKKENFIWKIKPFKINGLIWGPIVGVVEGIMNMDYKSRVIGKEMNVFVIGNQKDITVHIPVEDVEE